VAEKELDLFQLASVDMAELCARPPQVVRREMIKLHPFGTIPNHIPDHVFSDPLTPCGSAPANGSENSAVRDICRYIHLSTALFTRLGPGTRTVVTTLSDKIHDCPMTLANLDVFFSKGHQFCSTESASEQDRDHGQVTDASEALAVRFLKEHASLIAGESVAGPRAQLLHAFDSPDSGR
jgi:hypothetical protein